jgi:hypothetical protein
MRLACNIPLIDSFPYQGRTKGGLRCVLPNASVAVLAVLLIATLS